MPKTPEELAAIAAEREARKNVGIFDTDLAKANKAAAHAAINSATAPIVGAAKTYGKPAAEVVHAKAKEFGKAKIVMVIVAICVIMAAVGALVN